MSNDTSAATVTLHFPRLAEPVPFTLFGAPMYLVRQYKARRALRTYLRAIAKAVCICEDDPEGLGNMLADVVPKSAPEPVRRRMLTTAVSGAGVLHGPAFAQTLLQTLNTHRHKIQTQPVLGACSVVLKLVHDSREEADRET